MDKNVHIAIVGAGKSPFLLKRERHVLTRD
jgi:hypothetical protein